MRRTGSSASRARFPLLAALLATASLLVACATPGSIDEDGAQGSPTFVARTLDLSRPAPEDYEHLVARLGGGVCALDADGRPPLDLFFPGRRGSSRLLLGRGELRYEVTEVDAGDALGCLAFDADADGDTDLLVTGVGTIRLLVHEGDRFVGGGEQLAPDVAPGHVYASAAAGDLDADGDVDLVVAGFVDATSVPEGDCDGFPCAVLIGAQAPLPNRVFRREADRFVEVADPGALGIAEPTLVLGITDVDEDGRQEVYVGNDAGDAVRDRVVRLEGGHFVDVADQTGMAYDSGGHGIDTMGWTLGDVNGDLRFDYAVGPFEGYHTPIFVCGEDGWCFDEGRQRGTSAVADRFRWGVGLADLDLDGDVDLLEACGHVFTEAEGASAGFEVRHAQAPDVLENVDGRFAVVEHALPELEGRGLSLADLDDDGRLDAVVSTTRGPATILRGTSEGHYLRVALRGPPLNPDGLGATVEVRSRGRRWVRRRVAGQGFLGSFDPRLHFGVPDAPARVEVRWPDGSSSLVETGVDREVEIAHGG